VHLSDEQAGVFRTRKFPSFTGIRLGGLNPLAIKRDQPHREHARQPPKIGIVTGQLVSPRRSARFRLRPDGANELLGL
jgi:hypothetical protein